MSFAEAAKMMETINERFKSTREEAVKAVSALKISAFHLLGDSISRLTEAVEYLSEIERAAGVSGTVGKICDSWNYVNYEKITSVSKLKPALALMHDSEKNLLKVSMPVLAFELQPSKASIIYRGNRIEIPLTLKGVEEKADLIKALGSKILYLVDAVSSRVEACGKIRYGVRI